MNKLLKILFNTFYYIYCGIIYGIILIAVLAYSYCVFLGILNILEN